MCESSRENCDEFPLSPSQQSPTKRGLPTTRPESRSCFSASFGPLTLRTGVTHHGPTLTGPDFTARKGDAMIPAANVVVLVGSLRKDSLNRKTAHALIALNAAPLKFEIAEIGHLPLYNQDLVFLNVPAMQQPEAYIGGAANLFDAEGKMTNESTHDFLGKFVQSFSAWIETNRKR